MAEAGKQPRFAQKFVEIQILSMRNFEGDLLVDPGVFGEINGAKAAAAEGRDDAVLADRLAAEEHVARQYRRARLYSRAWCHGSSRRTQARASRRRWSRCRPTSRQTLRG